MVTLIKQLIARGHAYEAGGEVLFDTQSMPDYGALSGRKLDEQNRRRARRGRRAQEESGRLRAVEAVVRRRAGMGKPVGQGTSGLAHRMLGDERGLSRRRLRYPWRRPRPDLSASRERNRAVALRAWHARDGELLDAQRLPAGRRRRRCRSRLGNFVTIRDLLADWPGEVLRLNMLKTHYRSPIDWTLKGLEESAKTLDDWYWVAADIKGEQPADAVIEALVGRPEHAADDRLTARLAQQRGLRE